MKGSFGDIKDRRDEIVSSEKKKMEHDGRRNR